MSAITLSDTTTSFSRPCDLNGQTCEAALDTMRILFHELCQWLECYDVTYEEITQRIPKRLNDAIAWDIEKMDKAMMSGSLENFKYHMERIKELFLEAYDVIGKLRRQQGLWKK